jgi:hypothetical protein
MVSADVPRLAIISGLCKSDNNSTINNLLAGIGLIYLNICLDGKKDLTLEGKPWRSGRVVAL